MKKLLLFIVTISFCFGLKADEGMWIPLLLKYNEAEMQQMGFKLTTDDIYSVNHHSMKDAIVLFGGGCTAELVSPEGLIVTNHHCGYSLIHALSTLENDYLHNGFWAKNRSEEIPNKGLTVTFLVRMEDVTDKILEGIEEDMCELDRVKLIDERIANLQIEAVKGTHYTAVIKPFFYGNQYFMYINEVFKDIRMVGAPPENIGKFGGDTDNWTWPRHTGDFAIYRIYTDKDGKPAEYSPDNIPLKSKQFFKINKSGVQENDFTLVFGYPGRTRQFLISDAVDLIVNVQNPVGIHQRGIRLDIMKKYMDQSMETRLMYSGKANSISNGWKKWIGENKGLLETGVIAKKQQEEKAFTEWVNKDPERMKMYGDVLPDLKAYYKIYAQYAEKETFFLESFPAVELIRFAYSNITPLSNLYQNPDATEEEINVVKEKIKNNANGFYVSFNKDIDQEIFVELMHYYFTNIDPTLIPADLKRFMNLSKDSWREFAEIAYNKSPLTDLATFTSFIHRAGKKEIERLQKNVLFQLTIPAYDEYFANRKSIEEMDVRLNTFYRTYVKALMEKDTDRHFYPDANLTMRVAYGQVKGFSPEDGKKYLHFTTLDGVIQKENPNIFDYKVDPKLKALYESNDFGDYTMADGRVPVAFIASNHTTGGNSGSPVINANGELIGVNFDRVWEGTMSDVNYDVNRCRNISLDIRYLLFIVDKFAGAKNIIEELVIVE